MAIGQFMPMFAGGREPDPHWNNVVAMFHFSGSTGSTSFPDTSFNNLIWSNIAGNTQISLAQSKFGDGSIYFDGTGDYLYYDGTALAEITQDYTIEFWCKRLPTTGGQDNCIIDMRTVTGNYEPFIKVTSAGIIWLSVQGSNRLSTSIINTTDWYHVAVSRTNGVFRLFLNGVQQGSTYTNTSGLNSGKLTVGTYVDQRNANAAYHYDGYLNDLRITKNVSRYTANFTPPIQQFTDF